MKRPYYYTRQIVLFLLLSGCSTVYTQGDVNYIHNVRAVNRHHRFPNSREAEITNKTALFLTRQLEIKMDHITPDSIISVVSPDSFYWIIGKTRDKDSFGLDIVCKYKRKLVKRGEMTAKKDAQAAFSGKALMYYLITGEYVLKLIDCKSCEELAHPSRIEAD